LGRGNPYPHRYKYGVIKRPIDLDLFTQLMSRVPLVDLQGYSVLFIQALHALFYWTGLRLTEVIGRKEIRYLVDHEECKGKGCEGCKGQGKVYKVGAPHPGILTEEMTLQDGFLLVSCIDDKVLKYGSREAPIWLHESLPFVDLIIQQWRSTRPGERVFPIGKMAFWRICKRMDPKFTTHFYRHNRITELSGDEEMSLADICSHTGLSPVTVASYMMRTGRFTRKVGERMREKFGVSPPQ